MSVVPWKRGEGTPLVQTLWHHPITLWLPERQEWWQRMLKRSLVSRLSWKKATILSLSLWKPWECLDPRHAPSFNISGFTLPMPHRISLQSLPLGEDISRSAQGQCSCHPGHKHRTELHWSLFSAIARHCVCMCVCVGVMCVCLRVCYVHHVCMYILECV